MKWYIRSCKKVGTLMNAIAGTIVFFMMMLTVTDVVMRYFGKPILGSYEIVSLTGAIIIGLAIPKTSLVRGHVYVDILLEKRSEGVRRVIFVLTRIPSIALFIALTWFLFTKGHALHIKGAITSILQIPQYLLVYLLSFCCFVECLVLTGDIFRDMHEEETI